MNQALPPVPTERRGLFARLRQTLFARLTSNVFRLEPTQKQLDNEWKEWGHARRRRHVSEAKKILSLDCFEREYNRLMCSFSEDIAKRSVSIDDLTWRRGQMAGLALLKKRLDTLSKREVNPEE